jgi:hypothetical protein
LGVPWRVRFNPAELSQGHGGFEFPATQLLEDLANACRAVLYRSSRTGMDSGAVPATETVSPP